MIIEHARAQHLQVPIDHPVKTAFGTMHERHALFLYVEDVDGHCGIGESWVNFPVWAPWERRAAYERVIIPWLQSREVQDVPATMAELYGALRGPAQQSGTLGPLLSALCAVELALWDLAAQNAGRPLARLLYERPAKRVRVYASGINSPIPWELVDEHLDRGVTLFKLKLGFGEETDRANLTALCRHLGERARVAVDVNRAWTLGRALAWLDRLRDLDVQWLEEPLRADQERHLPVLRGRGVPIAGAENTLMAPGCDARQLAAAPFDVLQPDLTKYAALHVAMALIEPARKAGKRLIPHFLGSAPGGAASLHYAAGCDEALLEWDINANPLRTAFYDEPFAIRDGMIDIPDTPGLGWHPRA